MSALDRVFDFIRKSGITSDEYRRTTRPVARAELAILRRIAKETHNFVEKWNWNGLIFPKEMIDALLELDALEQK
jgi:uncharacterized membrane protein